MECHPESWSLYKLQQRDDSTVVVCDCHKVTLIKLNEKEEFMWQCLVNKSWLEDGLDGFLIRRKFRSDEVACKWDLIRRASEAKQQNLKALFPVWRVIIVNSRVPSSHWAVWYEKDDDDDDDCRNVLTCGLVFYPVIAVKGQSKHAYAVFMRSSCLFKDHVDASADIIFIIVDWFVLLMLLICCCRWEKVIFNWTFNNEERK